MGWVYLAGYLLTIFLVRFAILCFTEIPVSLDAFFETAMD